MPAPHLDPNLTAFETALTALTPVSPPINRDALLFRAGQASMRRGWFWPSATGIMTAVAASLALIVLFRPIPQSLREVQVVRVEVPVESRTQAPSPSYVAEQPRETYRDPAEERRKLNEHLVMQRQLLRWGLDALPYSPPIAASPPVWKEDFPRPFRPIQTAPSGWLWFNSLFDSGEPS